MKALSKPISSPGRTEKFPPPLMRFLRSNIGSRSRKAKSKSRPMFFFRRKNAGPINIETTQEPSSPKVTCIGQVKIRRSSKSSTFAKPKRSNSSRPKLSKQTPGWWVRRVLCCNMFFPKCPKPKVPRPLFRSWGPLPKGCAAPFGTRRKWAQFFRCGYCQKGETSLARDDDSSRIESIPRVHNNNSSTATSEVENSDFVACSTVIEAAAQIQESKKEEDFVNNPPTPPKNAFLLTRCRSAPYRSSSLASRFWGSPLKDEEEEEEENNRNNGDEEEEGGISSSPMCRNEVAEPRFSSQSEEIIVINTSSREAKSIQDLRAIGGSAVHPLLLTRCKSEPARTGERLLVNL